MQYFLSFLGASVLSTVLMIGVHHAVKFLLNKRNKSSNEVDGSKTCDNKGDK